MSQGGEPQRSAGSGLDRYRHIDVASRHEATIVCTYDLARFSAAAVIDVLRSHPVAVIGGMVHENPFHVPAGELLRELRERRAGRGGHPAAAPVA